jgi:hypothetical protein
MSSAALEVQTAIFAILDADVTLSALVTGVFDDVPESYTDFPYVTLGEDVLTEFDTDVATGFRVSVTIHCWSQYKGQRETKLVQDAIYRALHHVDMTVSGHNVLLSRQVDQTSERDPDGMTRHGVQTFELLVRDADSLPSSILSPNNLSLLAMYTMDRFDATTYFDESPGGNDLTIVGSPTVGTGIIGDSFVFSSGANTLRSTDTAFIDSVRLGGLGISGWVFVGSANVAYMFGIGDKVATQPRAQIQILGQDGTSQINIEMRPSGAGSTTYRDTRSMAPGWRHIVVQREGADVVAYIDGVRGVMTAIDVSAGLIWWGDMPSVPDLFISSRLQINGNGELDQIRLFNRNYTQAEVDELFAEGAP